MSKINQELKELAAIMNSGSENREQEFQAKFNDIKKRYTGAEDNEAIADFVINGYHNLANEAEELERQISIQERIKSMKEIVPISYIARQYFGKSAAWLQQRIYGYKVRGKVYTLSKKDIETFNFALQDISKKIGSLSIS